MLFPQYCAFLAAFVTAMKKDKGLILSSMPTSVSCCIDEAYVLRKSWVEVVSSGPGENAWSMASFLSLGDSIHSRCFRMRSDAGC